MRTAQLPLLALLAVLPADDASIRSAKSERVAEISAPTEMSLFYQPTLPVPIARVVAESSPVTALVVAMPDAQVLGNAAKEEFFRRLITIAASYVRVVVLVDEDDQSAVIRIRKLLGGDVPKAAVLLERVTFVRARVDTEWIRDYGPLFGETDNGEPVILDNMYRDLRREADTRRRFAALGLVRTDDPELSPASTAANTASELPVYLSDYGHFWRRKDDAAPMYINEFLYRERGKWPNLVRPPLLLSGGDVTFTHDGRMITSTAALEANGGSEARFRELAQAYFNADDVTYLRPLPNTISHVDMFFKVVGPGVMLLGEYAGSDTWADTYLGLLERETHAVLEWNRTLIAERFPNMRIIRVPMPPLALPVRVRSSESAPTGLARLDAALAAGDVRIRPRQTVVVRSFLNSIVLNGIEGRSAVLVPTFTGLENIEGAVHRAYSRAMPHAQIHFVSADAVADEFGGIHCVTIAVPAWKNCPSDSIECGQG